MVRWLLRPLRDSRGQGILSHLVAAAIVSTAIVGTASLANHLVRGSRRSQLMNRAVQLESQVTSALLRKDQFDPTAHALNSERLGKLATLKAGGDVLGLPLLDDKGAVLAIIGGRTSFDAQGNACPAPGPDCPLTVDTDINCAGADPQCMAAYRVTVWPDANSPQPAPLGAPFPAGGNSNIGGRASFVPAHYMNPISYDAAIQDAASSCDPNASDILITGVNRVTGRVSCIKKRVTECAPGEIAKTVVAVNGHMEMVCTPLAQAQCPDDYVLQNLPLAQLDRQPATGGVVTGLTGTCVYRWLDNGPWQKDWPIQETASTTTVSMQFCNDVIYKTEGNGSCNPVVTSDNPGTCWDPCPPCDKFGCASCPRTVHSTVSTDGGQVSGATASCTLTIADQCGSSMTAYPEWSGRCRTLNQVLTRPVK